VRFVECSLGALEVPAVEMEGSKMMLGKAVFVGGGEKTS